MTPLVPYRITICGLDELSLLCAAGVTHVLSILDPGWPDPTDFADYGRHRRTVWRFHDVIREMDGMEAPTRDTVARILEFGEVLRTEAVEHLLIHCHMGISRSTATAAILLAQHHDGREAEAFDAVLAVRPCSWPNSLMIRMADDMLGREGRLVEAMRAHHARVAQAFPDFAELLRRGDRAGEVPDQL